RQRATDRSFWSQTSGLVEDLLVLAPRDSFAGYLRAGLPETVSLRLAALLAAMAAWLGSTTGSQALRPRWQNPAWLRSAWQEPGALAPGQRLGYRGQPESGAEGGRRGLQRDHRHSQTAGVAGPERGTGDDRCHRLSDRDGQDDRRGRGRLS